jgi:uncharacterized protein (DUF934 family)
MPPPLEGPTSPPSPPPPSWGRAGEGGMAEPQTSTLPPPLTPPHKGEGNPRGTIWREGAFHLDMWIKAGADPLPADAPVILTKSRWLAELDALRARTVPLGLLLAAGEEIEDVAADLHRFGLIALDFPKFSDGRAFSTARLLREKYGYAGELRAVGNVLSDQIPLMRRVGFDSFEVTHGPTRRALVEGRIADVTLHYQPASPTEPATGIRPWLRGTAG